MKNVTKEPSLCYAVTAMMIAMLLSVPTGALCQTTVTAGKNVQSIGVTAAAEGAQETITLIEEEGQEVTADEGSTVRVIGNSPEEGKVARLKLTRSKATGSEEIKVTNITIDGETPVEAGKSTMMKAIVTPADAININVTWSVIDCDQDGNETNSQENADISEDGLLRPINEGYVKVTATANDGGEATGTKIVRITNFNSTNFNSTETGINPGVETGGQTGGGSENGGQTASEYTILKTAPDTGETMKIKLGLTAANQAGDVFFYLPAGVKAALGKFTEVSEMVTVIIPTGLKEFRFKKMFQTPFKAREKVMCLIAIPSPGGDEWIVVSGASDADGAILMTLSESQFKKTAGKIVVYIPVQKTITY